jgi:peptidoglycan LD-endopeptidase CwlK
MKIKFLSISLLATLCVFFTSFSFKKTVETTVKPDTNPCLKKLLQAYPNTFIGTENKTILWADSTKMVFDDGLVKDFQMLLDKPDLEDQVCATPYPNDTVFNTPKKNEDPGRVRFEPFFRKMYGNTEAEVKANLVEIIWLPKHLNQKLKVSKINGVAAQFTKISEELDQHPEWVKYLKDPAGTFNWRTISGTNRLSTHSFGITIDINTAFSNYWQWDNKAWKQKGEAIDLTYINHIPLGIVKIFEKYGFVWGGRWYHYDTMHFEYRPELLVK